VWRDGLLLPWTQGRHDGFQILLRFALVALDQRKSGLPDLRI
jgi:hypothetical protein